MNREIKFPRDLWKSSICEKKNNFGHPRNFLPLRKTVFITIHNFSSIVQKWFFSLVKDIDEWNNFSSTMFDNLNFISQESLILADISLIYNFWNWMIQSEIKFSKICDNETLNRENFFPKSNTKEIKMFFFNVSIYERREHKYISR